MLTITKQQARQFILAKQGLIGAIVLSEKMGHMLLSARPDASSMILPMYAARMRN